MKVVIDSKIPFIRETAARLFDEVVYLPGRKIGAGDVKDADALIIRTRTKCNRALLAGSKVKFVATTTIGFDHIDTAFLKEAGIAWTNCIGCNALSVAQYIHSTLLVMKRLNLLEISGFTVGIVGVGHVGTAVRDALQPFGCHILLNDPPRQQQEGGAFVDLETIGRECDVITFHTPLTKDGAFPSFHLANQHFFETLKRKPILINAARGGVVDEAELLKALHSGAVRAAVIDTWEGEPDISLSLLEEAVIGTPHIAGYSADGKANATNMVLHAICKFFNKEDVDDVMPPALPHSLVPSEDSEERDLQLYDPRRDSKALKSHPEKFESLREDYPLRREVWDFGNK